MSNGLPTKFTFQLAKIYVVPGQHPGKHTLNLIANISYQAEGIPAGEYIKKQSGYEGLRKYAGAGNLLVPITAEPKQFHTGFVCRINQGWGKEWPEGVTAPSILKDYFGLTAISSVENLGDAARATARQHWNTKLVPDSPYDLEGPGEDPTIYTQVYSSSTMKVLLRGTKVGEYEYYGEGLFECDELGSVSIRAGVYGATWKVNNPGSEGQPIESRAGQQILNYLMPLITQRWEADKSVADTNAVLEAIKAVHEADEQLVAAHYQTVRAQAAMRGALLKLAGTTPTPNSIQRALLLAKEKGVRL